MSVHFNPSNALAAATALVAFESRDPSATKCVAPVEIAYASSTSSLRTLFPANPTEPISSRLHQTSTPIASLNFF